jgi:hypothetical protein
MIVKSINKNGNTKLEVQGTESEKRMEFYLNHHFKDNKNVFVFNDLYVEHNDEIAQIDHLVLFSHGSFIIESKSCLGQISFNTQDEWKRKTKTSYTGFQSPIKQTERQFRILTLDISNNSEKLLDKVAGLVKGRYGLRVKDSLVAIDDRAILVREKNHKEYTYIVMKADHICQHIVKRMKDFGFIKNNLIPRKSVDYLTPSFNKLELERIVKHLLAKDRILRDIKYRRTNSSIDEVNPSNGTYKINNTYEVVNPSSNNHKKAQIKENKCLGCNTEEQLEIKYGRYGYYFVCNHCNKNSNIKEPCPSCLSKKTKVKKFKSHYYLDCSCGFNDVYFINK